MKRTKDNLPINFGMNALALFSEAEGITMNDVFAIDMTAMTFKQTLSLLYSGVRDGARKAGEELKYKSLEDFIDYAEDNEGVVAEIITIFAENRKESSGEASKKK